MQVEIGKIYEGTVKNITKYGAFVEIPNPDGDKIMGMVHISEVSRSYVNEIRDFVTEGQQVRVKAIGTNPQGKISLSMKQAEEKKERAPRHRQENKGPIRPADIDWSASSSDSLSFEDKLSKFKQDSDEKMQTLRRNNDSKRSGGYSRKNTHSF